MSMQMTGDTPLTRLLAGMTLAELRRLRGEYRAELDATQARADVLEGELARVDQAISEKGSHREPSRKQRRRSSTTRPARVGPSLRESILAILDEQEAWNRDLLWEEIKSRGLAPEGVNPKNTFNSRLMEAVARGEARKLPGNVFAIAEKGREQEELLKEEEAPAG